MKVLIAEDGAQYVGYFAEELTTDHGLDVVVTDTPGEAGKLLASGQFDVAVVDILFDAQIAEFDRSARSRQVPLTASRLVLSGLSVIDSARKVNVPVAVWTTGEPNRHLHLVFAYELQGVRSFCSKQAGSGSESLHQAIVGAAEGRPRIDAMLRLFLPPDGAPALAETILSGPASKRAIWRALAYGAHSRDEVHELTGIAKSTIGNLTSIAMFDDLALFDAGIQRPNRFGFQTRAKFNELVRYATSNRAFFLDDAVRASFR